MQNLKNLVWKMTWGIWPIFTKALKSVKIETLMRILLSKVENAWATNLQRIYVHWHGIMIANLKRNWFVSSKLTLGIWQMLTVVLENPKNFPFNGLLLTRVYNVWAKKVQRSYFWWLWRLMQSLKKNWLVLSIMAWGIWQIFTGWKIAISF